jgi:hypothetical protein
VVDEKEETENPAEELVWDEEELRGQIRSLENQISVAQKQHANIDEIKTVRTNLKLSIDSFKIKQFTEAEKHVLDVKEGLYEIIHMLSWRYKPAYFVSVWSLIPILTAFFFIFLSFTLMSYIGYAVRILYIISFTIPKDILGIVPLWAPLIGVIGASVQILIGIVNDYKEKSMISKYKRIWYFVLPLVGFVFGFIAILLTQAGLINMTQGQFSLNQTNITEFTNFANGTTLIKPSAYPIIICFLAGYLTPNSARFTYHPYLVQVFQ